MSVYLDPFLALQPFLLLICLLIGPASHGQLAETQQSITHPFDVYIINQAKLYEDDSYQLAYINRKLEYAQQEVATTPWLKTDPAAIQNYYLNVVRSAQNDFDAESWRGGWLEAGLKATAAGGFAAGTIITGTTGFFPAFALGAGGVIVEKGIEKGLDAFSTSSTTPQMPPNEVLSTNMWGYDVVLKGRDRTLAKIETNLIKKYHKFDLSIHSLDEHPAVAQAKYHLKIQNELSNIGIKLDFLTANGNLTRNGLKRLKDILEKSSSQTQKNLNLVQKKLTLLVSRFKDEQEQKKKQKIFESERSNVIGFFGVMEGLASLTKDPIMAQKFHQAGQLSGAIFDISRYSTKQAIADHPFVVASGYLMAANMAANLLSGAHADPQYSAIMAALRRISEQIESLRMDIMKRFDLLDRKLNYLLVDSSIHFNEIHTSLTRIDSKINNLEFQIQQIQTSLQNGLADQATIKLHDWHNRCLRPGKNGQPTALVSQTSVEDCLGNYLLLASGYFYEAARIGEDQIDKFNLKSLLEMNPNSYRAAEIGPVAYRPDDWIYGMTNYVQVVKANPKFRQAIRAGTDVTSDDSLFGNPGDRHLSLKSSLDTGKMLENMMRTIALQPVGNKYALKAAKFNSIVDQYRRSAFDFLDNLSGQLKVAQGDGPDLIKKSKTPVKLDSLDKYPTLSENIELCPGTQIEIKRDKPIPLPVEMQRGLQRFPKDGLPTGTQFAKIVPHSILWAERLGEDGIAAKVDTCISYLQFFVPIQNLPMNLSLKMKLSIFVTYDAPGIHKKRIEVAAFMVNENLHARYPLNPTQGPSVIESMWTGLPIPPSGEMLLPGKDGKFGILGNLDTLSPMNDQDDQLRPNQNLAEFQNTFDSVLNSKLNVALQNFSKTSVPVQKEIYKSVWQLLFLLHEGVNLNKSNTASDLYAWLRSGSLPLPKDLSFLLTRDSMYINDAKEFVLKACAKLKNRLELLSAEDDLEPGPDHFVNLIQQLEKIKRLKTQ